jgi:endonuclease/exonuclease/phosphatase family metal-dependent hydrolase
MRILSYNIHKGVGWQSRKSTFNQIHANVLELDPDIVFFQEILESQFERFSSSNWSSCVYGKNAAYKTDHKGNAIISKFPIEYIDNINLSMHRYENRGILHTISQNKLHLLCVHLGLFARDRKKQIHKIIEYINSNISNNDPLIIGGDFNDWNNFATKPLQETLHLEEAFLTSQKRHARTYPAWSPVFKLDRVYYRGIKLASAHRLIKKPWNLLSDHIGIEVIFDY